MQIEENTVYYTEDGFQVSRKKDLTKDLITEMKQAIEWYMDNTTVMNPSRSYQETFHDLGMNLRMRAEDILNTYNNDRN